VQDKGVAAMDIEVGSNLYRNSNGIIDIEGGAAI
jgi:hypothetical protein